MGVDRSRDAYGRLSAGGAYNGWYKVLVRAVRDAAEGREVTTAWYWQTSRGEPRCMRCGAVLLQDELKGRPMICDPHGNARLLLGSCLDCRAQVEEVFHGVW